MRAGTSAFLYLPICKSWALLLPAGACQLYLTPCNASSEPLCSLAEGLLLLLLQHRGVWGFPRSSVCLQGTHLPDWMERFCPTYFISSGGPWSHRQRAAHASAALAKRSSHTYQGKEKGTQEFWIPRAGKSSLVLCGLSEHP